MKTTGAGIVLIDSGTLSSAGNYTSPSWTAGTFWKVELKMQIAAFNGGGFYQAYGEFVGPANTTYMCGGYWTTGAHATSPFPVSALGAPGGGASIISQDQINASVPMDIWIVFFPLDGTIQSKVTRPDTAAGTSNAAQTTVMQNYTTSGTAVTGVKINFNGQSVSTSQTYRLYGYTV